MRKWISVLGAIAVSGSLMAGCGSKAEPGSGANAQANAAKGPDKPGKAVTIKIMNFKVEIAEQFNKLKEEYEKTHPGVKLQIDTVLGGDDYNTQLKARFASGEMPDIFNNEGYKQMDPWLEYLEDLSDQPWVKDEIAIAKEPMTRNGKVYGMPVGLEGLGFVYNKDMFAKAGITEPPKTLTQLEDAAKKLQAAGMQPFVNTFDNWFGLGFHAIDNAFAKQPDPNAFIKGLNDGSAKFTDNAIFKDWVHLFDLDIKYGNKNALTTDYNNATTMFATGKGAINQGGNWLQPVLDKLSPGMNVGIMPMPINDDEKMNDKLFVGPANNWVIYNKSPVKNEAKEFLNWLVSSEAGQKYLTKEFKFIPAFSNIKANPADIGPLSAAVQQYIDKGKVLGWHWAKFPDGAAQEFGASMQKYIAQKISSEQMLAEFQAAWDKMKSR
ncbi:ABC transporter substrate-binding protein [Gordoniibacillus kamchatkensis]|uniref:ABC transporter substrate-binding protein n=1 Tax=Gordoniibacillus kamchatkensis TaxID=1590651 RepID=A0ABR5AMR9_9BACL|nr:extracellular solute-binding protein [Paenibacillus sp. VKM B-2647]KIL41652.1 ABC transporter substrate-binding protein [Paenibacillus sp. VKM B-2647]